VKLPILATLILTAAAAHAQPAPPNPGDPAEAAYQEGKRLYDIQEWDQAIAKFKDAYRQRSDAASLFNIAQSYRLKGDCANAISFYKTYKRNFPSAENLDKVDKFIAELEPTCPREPAPPLPPPVPVPEQHPAPPQPVEGVTLEPPPPPSNDDPGHGKKLAGYIALGVGGAGIIGGVVLGVAAHGKANDVTNGSGPWDPSLETSGERDQRYSRICFAVGAAGVIAGGVLWFLGHNEAGEALHTVAVAPLSEGGGAFVVSGRF
jgi:tetratricopeptide (TPR) repeat protein